MHQLTGDFYTVGEVLDAYHAAVHPPSQNRRDKPPRNRINRRPRENPLK